MSRTEHRPVVQECSCGARVPMGRFDDHVREAHTREAIRSIQRAAALSANTTPATGANDPREEER